MINIFYYTVKNLIYYRKERLDIPVYIDSLESAYGSNAVESRRILTNIMLGSVGLKVIDSIEESIPWYIPLSKIQKSWIDKVSKFGYMVGLI